MTEVMGFLEPASENQINVFSISRPPDKLGTKSFAESMNLDGRVLAGMITMLKTNLKIRLELKNRGYADEQIPKWVAKLQPDQADLADHAPTPANALYV